MFVGSEDDEPAPDAVISLLGTLDRCEVLNAVADVMYRYAQWERTLDELCFANAGIQALLDASTPFLRNNVVVVDPALKLLAYTKDVPCDDPITMELIKHGYHTEGEHPQVPFEQAFRPVGQPNLVHHQRHAQNLQIRDSGLFVQNQELVLGHLGDDVQRRRG